MWMNWIFYIAQFSHSVMSDSLWPRGLQHPRLPCPSPTPRACSNSCPSSQWCHPTISSCHPLLLLPSIFPKIRVFHLKSLPFPSDGQTIRASVSVLAMNIQDCFPLGLTGLIPLQSRELSKAFNTTVQKHQCFRAQLSLWSSSHICTWLLEKPQLWLYRALLAKWCFCFLICS